MWYCDSCGAQNGENSKFCGSCGAQRMEDTVLLNDEPQEQQPAQNTNWAPPAQNTNWAPPAGPARVTPPPQKPKKKSLWWIWLIAGVVTLIALLVIGFFTIHAWSPATCYEPRTCKLCGKTEGFALGHDASPATCTEPSICSRCGEVLSPALGHQIGTATCTEPAVCSKCGEVVFPALGHDWLAATYDSPETCSRCGQTRGNVKGWIGDLDGYYSNEAIGLYGYHRGYPFLLNEEVHNCLHLKLYLSCSNVTGNPWGEWGLFARDLSGKWNRLDTFNVSKDAMEKTLSFDFYLNGKESFDALAILPLNGNSYSMNYVTQYTEVQEYIG